jgi:hypothetical protein
MLASPMKANASFRAWAFRRSGLIDFRRQRAWARTSAHQQKTIVSTT